MPNGKTINANELRALAEAADGMRGKEVELVWKQEGTGGSWVVRELDKSARPASEMIPITTAEENTDFGDPGKLAVIISASTGKAGAHPTIFPLPLDTFDALFWSTAAVDKFLIPYYARFKSVSELAKLREDLVKQDGEKIGVLHVRPSPGKSLTTGGIKMFAEFRKFVPEGLVIASMDGVG